MLVVDAFFIFLSLKNVCPSIGSLPPLLRTKLFVSYFFTLALTETLWQTH